MEATKRQPKPAKEGISVLSSGRTPHKVLKWNTRRAAAHPSVVWITGGLRLRLSHCLRGSRLPSGPAASSKLLHCFFRTRPAARPALARSSPGRLHPVRSEERRVGKIGRFYRYVV